MGTRSGRPNRPPVPSVYKDVTPVNLVSIPWLPDYFICFNPPAVYTTKRGAFRKLKPYRDKIGQWVSLRLGKKSHRFFLASLLAIAYPSGGKPVFWDGKEIKPGLMSLDTLLRSS